MTSKEYLAHCLAEAKKAEIRKMAAKSKTEAAVLDRIAKAYQRTAEGLRIITGGKTNKATLSF